LIVQSPCADSDLFGRLLFSTRLLVSRMGCGVLVGTSSEEVDEDGLQQADRSFLEFYRGSGKDGVDRTLEEIWSWDDITLEKRHDYIQVLFPTEQRSQFNSWAPDFPPALQEAFRSDSQIMANISKSFDVFLMFLGFRYDTDSRSIERTPSFSQKARNWLTYTVSSPNHNWLRCSRVLSCLRIVGHIARRDAFYKALEELYVEGLIPSRFQDTVKYWQQYGGIENRPVPVQCLSTGDGSSSQTSYFSPTHSGRKRTFGKTVSSGHTVTGSASEPVGIFSASDL